MTFPDLLFAAYQGLLKTPNSVNKRRSVCFVDHRNETAYLASASNDPDFIPGIIRVKTPQPKFDDKAKSAAEEEEEAMDEEVQDESKQGKGKGKGKAPASPAKRVEAGKRGEREALSPSGQNPRGSKRRRVEPSTYAGVTIARKVGKDGSSASYVQLADDAPCIEDIEAYFLDAANSMFADLMADSLQTPGKYFAGGKWAEHPSPSPVNSYGLNSCGLNSYGARSSGPSIPSPSPVWWLHSMAR